MVADDVKVGDYDPVTATTGDFTLLCAEHTPDFLFCTRPRGHDGEHVACGVGHVAAAVWT